MIFKKAIESHKIKFLDVVTQSPLTDFAIFVTQQFVMASYPNKPARAPGGAWGAAWEPRLLWHSAHAGAR